MPFSLPCPALPPQLPLLILRRLVLHFRTAPLAGDHLAGAPHPGCLRPVAGAVKQGAGRQVASMQMNYADS